jgi:hypothetical protein
MSDGVPSGWYPDPDDGGVSQRYWDGRDWTERVRAAGRPSPSGPAAQKPLVSANPPPVSPMRHPESRFTQFAIRMSGAPGGNQPPPPGPPQPPDFTGPPGPSGSRFKDSASEIIFLLRSIRAMMIFFTVLTVIAIILGIVGIVQLSNAASDSGF